MANGIDKMGRIHVHLSLDVATALDVGKRHGEPVILEVSAGEMHKQGYKFYISKNNVWLTDKVPVEFLKKM